MKLSKLMKKAVDFFSDEKQEQKKKVDELEKIINQLRVKRKKLHKKMAKVSNQKLKKDLTNEYNAVVKLLHKARRKHCKIS